MVLIQKIQFDWLIFEKKIFIYIQVMIKIVVSGFGNLKFIYQSKKEFIVDKLLQLKEVEEDVWDVGDWGLFEEFFLISSVVVVEIQSKKFLDDDWG